MTPSVHKRLSSVLQIEASGEQRGKCAELLGNDIGRVIGLHDAARAHPDRRRPGGDMLDDKRCRRRRDRRHVVMLGHPEPLIAPAFGVTGKRHRLRSAEHTSELQSLMRISYAAFCLQKKKQATQLTTTE